MGTRRSDVPRLRAVFRRAFHWTHESVVSFLKGGDPVDEIRDRARAVVFKALDEGWTGPPFDPIALADRLQVPVVARDDVREARTVPIGRSRVQIEFNPNRPRGRVRYSLAHEIAHTLFPDCADRVRHRGAMHEGLKGDDWQLESLCNVAAAEFLMPIGSLRRFASIKPSVDQLMALRKEYDVSTEAIFIRIAEITDHPCVAFCASRIVAGPQKDRYRLEYAIESSPWHDGFSPGLILPAATVVAQCTAIGFTAKGDEDWGTSSGSLRVECVGVPPYPGSPYPRVVGLILTRPGEEAGQPIRSIKFVRGDATQPRGEGHKLIAHIVNDATPNWGGGGFAQAVGRKWRSVQAEFRQWWSKHPSQSALGNTHVAEIDKTTTIAHMIAQQGFGPSVKPRIRYAALERCLDAVSEIARNQCASVHMPRIGVGNARGRWDVIEELIDAALCKQGVDVTVYDLPEP